MESLANQAGLAIETTRRLTETQERARTLAETTAAQRAELEAIAQTLLHVQLALMIEDVLGD
jgi:hypothetical protein